MEEVSCLVRSAYERSSVVIYTIRVSLVLSTTKQIENTVSYFIYFSYPA